jgi:glutamate-1-semialdehyde 2,1-aminomutase
MLDRGIYLAPSQYEAMFVGLAHTDEHIEKTIKATEVAFAAVRETGTLTK